MEIRQKILKHLRRSGELSYAFQTLMQHWRRFYDTTDPWEIEKLNQQSFELEDYFNKICKDDIQACALISKALENPNWDFRTISGIAKETDLDIEKVEEMLDSNPDLFRKLPMSDSFGKSLFTYSSRPIGWKERLAVFQSVLKRS